jgi:hypothetical protein
VAHATKASTLRIRLPNARLNNAIVNTERRPTAVLMPVSATVPKLKGKSYRLFFQIEKCYQISFYAEGYLMTVLAF